RQALGPVAARLDRLGRLGATSVGAGAGLIDAAIARVRHAVAVLVLDGAAAVARRSGSFAARIGGVEDAVVVVVGVGAPVVVVEAVAVLGLIGALVVAIEDAVAIGVVGLRRPADVEHDAPDRFVDGRVAEG